MTKVKALSFRQPWAELVLQGKKSLDLRTWSTRYRGPLAIYASQTVEKDRCLEHGIDPNSLTTGAVIGLVDLTGVVELDETAYNARASEHLSGRRFHQPMFGWELANPHPLPEPLPARGRLLLFEIDLPYVDDQLSERSRTVAKSKTVPGSEHPAAELSERSRSLAQSKTASVPEHGALGSPPSLPFVDESWSSVPPFELRLTPEASIRPGGASYRLALFQRKMEAPASQPALYRQPSGPMERLVELSGVPLRAVADQVLEALRDNGYKATDLNPSRREPFALQEEWGVRLGLLFLAVKPVSKVNRIEVISTGIREMTSEELYYWYSKCTSRFSAERAQKALRVLLAEE